MTFRKRDLQYLIFGLLIFIFIGIFWWTRPYEQLSMQTAVIRWSIFIFVMSFLFSYIFKLRAQKLILSSIISLLAVIIIRIITDKLEDSTTHDIFLGEIVVTTLVAALSSGAGVFFAILFNTGKSDKKNLSKSEIEQNQKKDTE